MSIIERVESVVRGFQPTLQDQGNDVSITEVTEKRIALTFSHVEEDPDSSEETILKLRQLLRELFPDIKEISVDIQQSV